MSAQNVKNVAVDQLVAIIPADEAQPIRIERIPYGRGELKELQTHVGGFIEVIRVTWQGESKVAFVNEEGLLKRLEHNPRASHYFGYDVCGTMVIMLEKYS